MRIAIFLNIRFYFDGHCYTADERYYEFWATFTEHPGVSELWLCVPLVEKAGVQGLHRVELAENVHIVGIPISGEGPVSSLLGLITTFRFLKRLVLQNRDHWDGLGAVIPNLYGLMFLKQADRYDISSFAYVRGDHLKTVSHEYSGLRKLLFTGLARLQNRLAELILRGRAILVVGKALEQKYRRVSNKVQDIVVSTIRRKTQQQGNRNLDIDIDSVSLLYVGRLSREKGVDLLIECLSDLNVERQRYSLVIVGEGPEKARLELLAAQLKVNDCVSFAGNLNGVNLMTHYNTADMLVLPSRTEGVPKVLIEGMCFGLPIVCTGVGGIPYIAIHESNALVVPPESVDCLSEAISRIVEDSALRAKISAEAMRGFAEYSLETQRERVLQFLHG